jgi:hypothetical protein
MYRNISAANVEFLGLDQLHPVGKNRRAIAAALAARRLGEKNAPTWWSRFDEWTENWDRKRKIKYQITNTFFTHITKLYCSITN